MNDAGAVFTANIGRKYCVYTRSSEIVAASSTVSLSSFLPCNVSGFSADFPSIRDPFEKVIYKSRRLIFSARNSAYFK